MARAASLVEGRQTYPGVIGAVPGRPDDGVDLQLAAVFETHRTSVDVHEAGSRLDAVAFPELARARADQRVPRGELPPQARVEALVQDPRFRQPPEDVAPEQ